jgi:DNA-binding NarL/FixJ family response regulator
VIRVLIADDEAIVRSGVRMVLDAEDDLEVVGEAVDGLDVVERAAALRPDVIVLDIRMPRLDGVEATRRLVAHDPDVRVVALTTFGEDEVVEGVLRAGASGFVLKVAGPEQLTQAIRTVAAGDGLIDPAVTKQVIAALTRSAPRTESEAAVSDLTPREREVLEAVAHGWSNAEIARRLVVSEATVKSHLVHIFQKLDLRDRVHAVVFAYEHGIVRPG